MTAFGFTYPGTGRWTGRVCWASHRYQPPTEPGGVGWWVGTNCAHPETDGQPLTPGWHEEFERQQHFHCHDPAHPGYYCKYCREAGWVGER
jgi:hypothetical protein